MSKKKKLIPELRFPEFKNEGEWNYDKIDNLFHLQDGYAFSSNAFTDSKLNTKQVIRITDINNQNKNGDKVFVLEETAKALGVEKYKVKKGDLLLSLTGAAGFNFFIWESDDAYINQRTMKLNPKKKENDSLKVILEPLVHSKINEIGTGQNNNLSKDALKEIEFPYPNPKEQEKIAYCLSSLDKVIESHNQKLDLLKDHKKGLMQNLFPQEGENVPKYRFPEFTKDGVWTEKSLDEVATILKGKGISKADIVEDGKLPCIRYGELYTHYNETISTVKSYTNSSPEDLILSKANDVIIPASGETQIDIAKASCVLESGVALGGDLNIIRSKINGVFLSYYLNNAKKHDIAQMAQGIAVVHLYPNQLKTLKLQVPNTKEQQKIALCLSTLEEIITVLTNKIEQLKQHKNGLMQGLFPKMIN